MPVPSLRIRKRFSFEAAHVLPHHEGKCARPHGHSYHLEVTLGGSLRESGPTQGMIEDFDALSRIVRKIVIDRLDHTSLNELIPNPTAELIALWIWEQLIPQFPDLEEITLWETAGACAMVRAANR